MAGHRRSCLEKKPIASPLSWERHPLRGRAAGLGAGSRVGAAEGGAPRKAGRPGEPAASLAPPRGLDRRSLPAEAPARPLSRLDSPPVCLLVLSRELGLP